MRHDQLRRISAKFSCIIQLKLLGLNIEGAGGSNINLVQQQINAIPANQNPNVTKQAAGDQIKLKNRIR